MVKQILQDQFIQSWLSTISTSSRGQFYSIFKHPYGIENYLVRLPESYRIWITKLRTSNLRLPIETGRWFNIPRHDRRCSLCKNGIGDEFHVLFVCTNPDIVALRDKYVPSYYVRNPCIKKMKDLLLYCNIEIYKRLAVFIRKIINFL